MSIERYTPNEEKSNNWLDKIAAPIVNIIKAWIDMLLGKGKKRIKT